MRDRGQRMDAPAEHDDDQGRTTGSERLNQLWLYTGEVKIGCIFGLADRNRAQQTAPSDDHNHGDIGITRCLHRCGETGAVIAQDLTALCILYLYILPQCRMQTRQRGYMRCVVRAWCVAATGLRDAEPGGFDILRRLSSRAASFLMILPPEKLDVSQLAFSPLNRLQAGTIPQMLG